MSARQEYVGLLIAAARRRLKQTVQSRVGAWRLTPQQFWCILAVAEQPGASLGELARRQLIDAPTASRVVTGLSRRRLLRLELAPDDRRRTRIDLTPAGAELAASLRPIAASVRAAAIAELSPAEEIALRKSLTRVIESLDKFDQQAARPASRAAAAGRRSG